MSGIKLAVGPEGFRAYQVTWSDSGPKLEASEEAPTGILAPGFVDIHIHGAFGVDFMSAPTADVSRALDELADDGYEKMLLTTVTAPASDVRSFLGRMPAHSLVAGVHLEGPFISPKFPGAQPPGSIALPSAQESGWNEIFADPRLRVVTLAPELEGSLELIRLLAGRSVKVGIGHTDATYEQALAGFTAGASHSTHTYNAMRPLHHREPGTVGFALTEDAFAAELIYDRVHVAPPAAQVLVRCKPADKLIAVSDGTMASGLGPGLRLSMWGLDVMTSEQDVRLLNGTLAGSSITLRDAFRNLAQDFGPELAIRATSLNPRLLLGLDAAPDVWLEFSSDFELQSIRRRESGFTPFQPLSRKHG